jgi:hypothetical protein
MSDEDEEHNVYHLAAEHCLLLACQNCGKWLASADVARGPKYPDEGWQRALGDHALNHGWQIEYGGEWLLI